MPSWAGAVEAIKDTLTAEWTLTPVGFINEAPPVSDREPWILLEVVTAARPTVYPGNPGDHAIIQSGLIYLHVLAPKGRGTDAAFTHAGNAGEIFRDRQLYAVDANHAVRSWTPVIEGGGRHSDDGNWFVVTCTIPFDYWHRG
ncbi:MAG: hypothetical protein AB7O45_12030 [Alphaproteobacteria bacterium]